MERVGSRQRFMSISFGLPLTFSAGASIACNTAHQLKDITTSSWKCDTQTGKKKS
jgi:hypothetical protein